MSEVSNEELEAVYARIDAARGKPQARQQRGELIPEVDVVAPEVMHGHMRSW